MHRNPKIRSLGFSFRQTALAAMLSILVLFASSLAFAQGGESGGVAGLVTDPSGAVVSGASVDVHNEQTKALERHTVTSPAGAYSVGSLRPGSYRVEVKAKGFKTYIVKFQARLEEVEREDVKLEVGTAAEIIEVNAAGTLIDTESPTTGQPIDNQTLTTLPLAEPNYLFLLGLSPGTGSEPTDVRKAGRSNVDISVNGQRTTNNSVTMEGINIDDFNLAHFDYLPIPNPEAIQEFKVATSLYDASLGSKGGGALALVLKSGTKNLHFGGWWNLRNDFFDANEWFRNHNTPTPLPTGKLIQNVVGVQAGGPFPWLKGFWYANVQGVRGRNGIDPNGSAINPTLPAFPTNPDGTTSAALLAAAYGVPASSIDPVALNILNLKSNFYGGTYFMPRPGQPQCSSAVSPPSGSGEPATFSCAFSGVSKPKDTQFTIRYDRPWRHDKDKLQIGLFWDNSDTFKPFGTATDLAFPQDNKIQNRFGNVSYIIQLSNRQLNELKFGASRFVFANTPTAEVTLSQVGSTRPDQSTFPGLWEFSTGINNVGIGVNDFRGTAQNSYQWGDNWSMVVGKHTLHAGGDIYRYQLNRFNNFGVFGNLGFSPNANSQATGWLDFITGTVCP